MVEKMILVWVKVMCDEFDEVTAIIGLVINFLAFGTPFVSFCHTHFEEIILDQKSLRGSLSTGVGLLYAETSRENLLVTSITRIGNCYLDLFNGHMWHLHNLYGSWTENCAK